MPHGTYGMGTWALLGVYEHTYHDKPGVRRDSRTFTPEYVESERVVVEREQS